MHVKLFSLHGFCVLALPTPPPNLMMVVFALIQTREGYRLPFAERVTDVTNLEECLYFQVQSSANYVTN